MPKGRAAIDAVGLDQARSWGATYWGGALFGLLADVEIREMTRNKQSLQDALRAVLEAGGNGERAWPLRRLLEAADRPLPRPVLGPLYDRMGGKPTKMDLDDLWKRLGVALGPDRQVVFDDRAPLAAVRRAITAPAR
jgi:predicted metalloprotease with PDZ domain